MCVCLCLGNVCVAGIIHVCGCLGNVWGEGSVGNCLCGFTN